MYIWKLDQAMDESRSVMTPHGEATVDGRVGYAVMVTFPDGTESSYDVEELWEVNKDD